MDTPGQRCDFSTRGAAAHVDATARVGAAAVLAPPLSEEAVGAGAGTVVTTPPVAEAAGVIAAATLLSPAKATAPWAPRGGWTALTKAPALRKKVDAAFCPISAFEVHFGVCKVKLFALKYNLQYWHRMACSADANDAMVLRSWC